MVRLRLLPSQKRFQNFQSFENRLRKSDKKDLYPREDAKNNLRLDKWFVNLPCETIELEVSDSARADVEEWLGIEAVYKGVNGRYYASAEMPLDDWLISKLLGYGDRVRVLRPKRLIDDLSHAANAILKLYN